MSQQYSIWVIKLAGRVKALEDKIPGGNVEMLDREANTCKAELQHLYDYAVQQNIELGPYYNHLTDIEARLRSIEYQLQQKIDRVESGKRSWWGKVLNIVYTAITLVASILGLSPLLRYLPGANNQKLLS